MTRFHSARIVLVLIVVSTILRLALSLMLGLGIDESYMVAAGRELHISYYDHPPLGWWLSHGAASVFGSEAPIIVRLPFIALFALSTWLMYRLTTFLYSPSAGYWAALTFNFSPVFGITSGSWVLPDGPLIAALLGFMVCLAHACRFESRHSWGWWIGVGVCAGLALLSKYSAILILFGAAIALLSHPNYRRWLNFPQPWLAIFLAAALFSPVIVWNMDHQWSSIAFQGGRALGGQWHPLAPLIIVGGEALYLLPWIWLPLVVALAGAWRRGRADWPGWMLACSGTMPIVLFALIGLWSHSRVFFHWAVPGYLVLFPLLGVLLTQWAQTNSHLLRQISVATGCLVVAVGALVGSEVRWNWLPNAIERLAPSPDPDLAAVDWISLAAEIKARGWSEPNQPILAVLRWYDAGKLDYALAGSATVICLGEDPREYGIIHPASFYHGKDIFVLAPGLTSSEIEKRLDGLFEHVESQPALLLLHNGRPAMTVPVYLGKRMKELG